MLGFTPDLWVPLAWHRQILPGDDELLERRFGGWLNVRGRLAPGVTLGEARAALGTIAARLAAEYPAENEDWQLQASAAPRKTEPFLDVVTGGALPVAAGALLAIVGIVLLVACANVASLQLARSMGREKEMALRISLGASRRQILRQLLLESLLLCAAAGVLGFWLGSGLLALALRMNPVLDFSIDYGVTTDGRVLSFTIAVSLLAGLLSGLLPAAKASRRDIAACLAERGSAGRVTGRRFLVIPQLALSLVALVVAGLLVESFDNLKRSSPGFDSGGVSLASFNLELQGYDKPAARDFGRRLLERVRALPEVTTASLAFPLPLDAYQEGSVVLPMSADPAQEEEELSLSYSVVSEDYFATIGTPLLVGRGFRPEDTDERPLVAVVNETMARKLWPEENVLGEQFRLGREGKIVEVVGVARDGKYVTLGEPPQPYMYLALSQFHHAPVTLLLRSDMALAELESRLRAEVRALDPTLPVYGVKTIGQFLERTLAGPRTMAYAVALFALLAASLAIVGIYGLMSFTVSQKSRELAVRIALGAQKRDVVALFVRQTASIVGLGVVFGLVMAWMSSRLLTSLLFGVGAEALAIFVAASALLTVVGLAGGYVPARRAAKLDPLVTLRHD